jgi:hypothetical protein
MFVPWVNSRSCISWIHLVFLFYGAENGTQPLEGARQAVSTKPLPPTPSFHSSGFPDLCLTLMFHIKMAG